MPEILLGGSPPVVDSPASAASAARPVRREKPVTLLCHIVLWIIALAPSAFLAWTWRAMPQLGLHHDDGVYLVSAKSLAEGNGYRIESLPGKPYQTKYPPMLSTLVAAVWKLAPDFPGNLKWMALLAWLMLPPYVLGMRAVFRQFGFPARETWLLTLLAATHPMASLLSTAIMSDLLFLALFLGCMLVAEKALDPAQRATLALAAGLLAGLAYFTRTAALPIALTVPACFLYRRQLRRAILFLAGMLPLAGGWQLWMSAHMFPTRDPSVLYYTDYLGLQRAEVNAGNLLHVAWTNVEVLLRSVGKLVMFDTSVGERAILERVLAVVAILGAVRVARSSGRLQYPAAVLGITGVLLAFHYPPDERLCLPLFPMVLMGFWTEARRFGKAVHSAWRKPETASRLVAALGTAILGGAALFLVTTYIMGNAVMLPQMYERCRSLLAARQSAFAWVRTNTPPESTLYAYDDPLLYLATGRKALGLPMPYGRIYQPDPEREADEFARSVPTLARSHKLDYLFLTSADFYREQRAHLTLEEAARMPYLRKEFSAAEALIYRVQP